MDETLSPNAAWPYLHISDHTGASARDLSEISSMATVAAKQDLGPGSTEMGDAQRERQQSEMQSDGRR